MTLEIKSERNFTFGTGEPAVSHEKAVETVKELVRLADIEKIKDIIDSVYGCDCAYYGVEGFAIAEALYNAGYRKQVVGEWEERTEYNELEDCEDEFYRCSECGLCIYYTPKFCPNCGAKMKGGESDDRH